MNRIEVKISGGVLVAQKSTDPHYPGIFLDFVPDTAEEAVPVALLEEVSETKQVRLLVWENSQEDYSFEIEYREKEVKK